MRLFEFDASTITPPQKPPTPSYTGTPVVAVQQQPNQQQFSSAPAYPNKQKYDQIVNKIAGTYGVNPNLVHAIIARESEGNPRMFTSDNYGGTYGLMQVTKDQFNKLGKRANIYNPAANIEAGVKELSTYIKKYNGNMEYALAAYNWSEPHVDQLIKSGWNVQKLPKLTQNYISSMKNISAM